MSTDNPVRCPPLVSLGFHDDLEASTLSNLIGTSVQFQCTGFNQILSGPSAIQCTTSGKWNNTLPTCITPDDKDSTSLFTEDVSVTPTATPDEQEVETVLIILWIAGGLLLIALFILIGCILKNHKKRRTTERLPSQGQGNPRHGGVNPTFTSYDEIWTWIPVVTENADNCRSQVRVASSGRGNRVNEPNIDSTRNLRLPSYNEAINSNRTSTQNATRIPSTTQSSAVPSQSTTNQTTLQIRPIPDIYRTSQASERRGESGNSRSQNERQIQSSRTEHVSMATNHYETIPADQNIQPHSTSNNISHINVTSTSGSALQQARDLVNRASAHAQRPLPSAPVLQSTNRTQPQMNERPNQRPSGSNPGARTQTSALIQSVYLPRYQQHTSQDFNHSNNSVFTYIGDHVHRTRTHQASTSRDDPPPPYSVTSYRTAEQQVHSSRTSAPIVASSHFGRLESMYF